MLPQDPWAWLYGNGNAGTNHPYFVAENGYDLVLTVLGFVSG